MDIFSFSFFFSSFVLLLLLFFSCFIFFLVCFLFSAVLTFFFLLLFCFIHSFLFPFFPNLFSYIPHLILLFQLLSVHLFPSHWMDLKLAALATFLSCMIQDVASHVTLGIIFMVHLSGVVYRTALGAEKHLLVKVRGSYLIVHAGLTVGWISR